MNLADFKQLDKQINVRADLGIVAKLGDNDQPVQAYEIVLVRGDHVIARAVGPRRSTTPVKLQLPLVWDANGHTVDGAKYAFLQKSGVAAEPTKGAGKKKGPKREGPTKLQKCEEIMKANPNLTPVDMKAKFVADAECTVMGANTYYLLLKKRLAPAA